MSASLGAMNVILALDSMISLRLTVIRETLHVIVNPKNELFRIKFGWNLLKSTLRLLLLYIIWRLSWLFSNWKQHKDMLELGVQVIIFCAINIGYTCLVTLDKSYIKFQFVMNNSWKRLGVETGWPNRHRIPKLPELTIYGMVLCFLGFPLLGIGYPIIVNNDPVQLIAHLCFPTLLNENYLYARLVKAIACAVYGTVSFYGALHTLFLILGATCFLDAITKFSRDIFPSAHTKNKMHTRCDSGVRHDFQQCYILYRQLRILVETGGKGIQLFLQVLIGMGVPLCSFSAFAVLKLGSHMNIIVWGGNALIAPFGVIACFVLVAFASIPNVNSKHYFQTWKRHIHRKYDRKRLASCMELAFNLGAVRRVTHGTALVILHNIVNYTVTLLCMYTS
ncbi:unnamed protein product [Orchesella dallaii]|uniref:Odorant receptor n=1 Tax=Orchesella dallaii TaxID=48710 RepID=A0ABP1RJF6_9HEXA